MTSFSVLTSYYDEFIDPLFPAKRAFFIRAEHYQRYVFAKQFVKQKKAHIVYDIACGDGYGTRILADVARYIYGVDALNKFLAIGKSQYNSHNTTFVQLDLETEDLSSLKLPTADVIVSFETLEHVEDPKKLLQQFYNNISTDGYLLLSTPNAKLEPKKKGKSRNIFHKHIFEKEKLVCLVQENGFVVEKIYGQSLSNILYHQRLIREVLNKITEHSLFLFKLFSYLGLVSELFLNKSYSLVVVARKR